MTSVKPIEAGVFAYPRALRRKAKPFARFFRSDAANGGQPPLDDLSPSAFGVDRVV